MLHTEHVRRLDKLVLDVRRKNSRVGGYRCPVSQYRTKKAKGKKVVCKGCSVQGSFNIDTRRKEINEDIDVSIQSKVDPK